MLSAERAHDYNARMTLANLVTVGRLALIPFIVLTLFWDRHLLSFLLLLGFFLGDLVDGFLARVRNEITPLGQFLDPLADKLLAFSLSIWFAYNDDLSWWAVGVLFVANAVLFFGSVALYRQGKATLPARWSGKLAATVLALGLSLLYLQHWVSVSLFGDLIVYVGVGVTLLAMIDYLCVGFGSPS